MRRKLRNLTKLELRGHALSPVKHLYLKDVEREHEIEQKTLNEIVDQVSDQSQEKIIRTKKTMFSTQFAA